MMETVMQELRAKLRDAEKVLVGIGAEWKKKSEERDEAIKQAAQVLSELLKEKDSYVITALAGEDLLAFSSALPMERTHMAAPFDVSFTEEEWTAYTDWLGRTLNKKLLLLELGEDFSNPMVFRWPFEKTAALNNKAFLYRVNKRLYQITDELAGKAAGIPADSVEFILKLGTEEEHGSNQQ